MVKTRRAQKQDNKEKKPTKTRQRKKQKTKHDDTDQEDSNSTTDFNNQSDSLYSPTSAKKPLMVDSMKIDSTRRASLRLSKNKNLIKTGIACSNPPKPKEDLRESPQKSIEHFPSSHAIRQLDDLAHQVLQGSKVESPARYLKKVGQNFRYREIEKGGECVAEEITDELDDIIGRMEKGKEAEKEVPLAEKLGDADNEVSGALQTYQVPQSSQVESPSRYLIQGEPSLRHEQIVEKGGKEVSLVQKPTSMATLELTEFINRRAVDEDDDVDSQRCAMHTVEGYRVKPESMAILKEILTKHGDIAKNCTVPIMEFRSGLLETICGIISQLQGKELRQVKEDFLLYNIAQVDGMKILGVDIEWLRVLLNDLLEAKQPFGEKFHKMKEQIDSNRKTIEDAKSKLRECKERKRKLSEKFREVSALLESALDEEIVWKETLAKAEDESTRITQTINSSLSKAKRFLDCSPLGDLL